jgi:hypothetical protein
MDHEAERNKPAEVDQTSKELMPLLVPMVGPNKMPFPHLV